MKFLKKLIQQHKCDHDYRNIDTDVREHPTPVIYYILYCPKCEKEKRANAEKYDREQTKKVLRIGHE